MSFRIVFGCISLSTFAMPYKIWSAYRHLCRWCKQWTEHKIWNFTDLFGLDGNWVERMSTVWIADVILLMENTIETNLKCCCLVVIKKSIKWWKQIARSRNEKGFQILRVQILTHTCCTILTDTSAWMSASSAHARTGEMVKLPLYWLFVFLFMCVFKPSYCVSLAIVDLFI